MQQRRLLYVTPVMPCPYGNGLAMRAAATLTALSLTFDVELIIVPVAGADTKPSAFALQHAARVHSLDLESHLDPYFSLISRLKDPVQRENSQRAYPKPYLSRHCTGESSRYLYDWSSRQELSAVHIMRLYLAPLAERFLQLKAERPTCVLDLDDDELRTRQRIADLHREQGHRQDAEREEVELEKYAAFADRYLSAFDYVTLCSPADVERLGRHYTNARFAAVPNSYVIPELTQRHIPSNSGPLRLLFVGTIDYFPNSDAVRFLCSDVYNSLRSLSDREIEIDVVGHGGLALASSLRGTSVRVHGCVSNLAPFYKAADVAVVPIRAGGGTRIKILEAFAHYVPVVSTTIGTEGIDAIDGEHLLLGDSAEALAHACLRIKSTPDLAFALAERAAALCSSLYGAQSTTKALAEIYQ